MQEKYHMNDAHHLPATPQASAMHSKEKKRTYTPDKIEDASVT